MHILRNLIPASVTFAALICIGLVTACSKKEAQDDSLVEIEVEQDEPAVPATFPVEMSEFRAAFEDSALRFASGTASAAETGLLQSKLLGTPYFPVGASYPLDLNGEPLQLLAQINFAELPMLPDFPTRGVLQFFVSPVETGDQVWGMRMGDDEYFDEDEYLRDLQAGEYFRVLYYPDADSGDPQGVVPPVAIGFLPVNQEARLQFREQTGYVTLTDFRFERIFGSDPYDFFEQFGQAGDLVWEQYEDFVGQHSVARVGGYADFAQEDPRVLAPDEDWLLLLQLDSYTTDDGVEVLWGDAGVGSFHIRREDLRAQDFSRVLYSWDSH